MEPAHVKTLLCVFSGGDAPGMNPFLRALVRLGLNVHDAVVLSVMWTVEHFNDTAGSHHRIMVLETMGRDCGYPAEMAALASGAEIVVIPERGPLDAGKTQGIAERLEESMHSGRSHGIVLVAEGRL